MSARGFGGLIFPAVMFAVLVGSGCGAGGETGAADGANSGQLESVQGGEAVEVAAEPSVPQVERNDQQQAKDAARISLEVDFHRTRTASPSGFWVLGQVRNPSAQTVTGVEIEVALLDESGATVGRARGKMAPKRVLSGTGVDSEGAFAVLVEQPPVHDQLELTATALAYRGPAPAPLQLRLEHEPPQRADFGGWTVHARVHNEDDRASAAARIEISGFDGEGRLLGLDWFEVQTVTPGETVELDIGELRYDEQPATLGLKLRRPS